MFFNATKGSAKKKGLPAGNAAETAGASIIAMRDVVKDYKTPAGPFRALKNINLQVCAGEMVAVIGKSGSGKSTLINMLSGIDNPTSGEVFVENVAVHKLNEGQKVIWRGKRVGVVFQFFQLLPTLTILENIMLPMDFCRTYPHRQRKPRGMELLDRVGLADQAHKLPSTLSGGQQQRAAIARALANDPPLIIADEPTGNLDSRTAEAVFQLFGNLLEQNKTILMVTHDSDLADRVTRTVIVSDGELIDGYLAKALPTLSDEQLRWATRKLETRTYAPGEVILQRGAQPEKFFIVAKGQVEVQKRASDGHEAAISLLESGQHFGEIELVRGGVSRATVRTPAGSSANVMTLDRSAFDQLLDESEPTRAQIAAIVDARVAEQAQEQTG